MWLIKKGVAELFEHARAQGTAPPPGAIEAFNRRFADAAANGEPRIFKRAGDVAEIVIKGVLTAEPDWYAYFYGGGNTTYPEIIQSLALAAADDSVKRIVLNVCSPGGYVGGLFDTLAALEAFPKPKETFAAQADSAAYAIAALGGKITASNPAAEFGSVGVCATYVQYDFEKVYDITSSNAPNKRPDPSTEEGQKVIRKYLDAIEELFVDAIARGRGTTVDDVITNFGRGEVMLAGSAKKLKMIDKISKATVRSAGVGALPDSGSSAEPAEADAVPAVSAPAAAPVAAAAQATQQPSREDAAAAAPAPKPDASAAVGGAPNRTTKKMDESQLQAEHPGLYAAVFNKGKAEGKSEADKAAEAAKAEEKDRIEAHLEAGEQSGDMKTALESIRSGAKMTQKLMTTYMMAGMRKGAIDARDTDDKVAADATAGAAGGKPAKTLQDQIADEIEAQTKGGAAA